jgi:hypothetical protein
MLNNHRVFMFLKVLALAGAVSAGGCGGGGGSGSSDEPISVFSLDLTGGEAAKMTLNVSDDGVATGIVRSASEQPGSLIRHNVSGRVENGRVTLRSEQLQGFECELTFAPASDGVNGSASGSWNSPYGVSEGTLSGDELNSGEAAAQLASEGTTTARSCTRLGPDGGTLSCDEAPAGSTLTCPTTVGFNASDSGCPAADRIGICQAGPHDFQTPGTATARQPFDTIYYRDSEVTGIVTGIQPLGEASDNLLQGAAKLVDIGRAGCPTEFVEVAEVSPPPVNASEGFTSCGLETEQGGEMLFCLDTAEAGGNVTFVPGTVPMSCLTLPESIIFGNSQVGYEVTTTKFVSRRTCPTPDRVHICPAQSFDDPATGALALTARNLHVYGAAEQFVETDGDKLDDQLLLGLCPGGTTVFNRVILPPRPAHTGGSMFPGGRPGGGGSCEPLCAGLPGIVNEALAGAGVSFSSFGNSFAWGN